MMGKQGAGGNRLVTLAFSCHVLLWPIFANASEIEGLAPQDEATPNGDLPVEHLRRGGFAAGVTAGLLLGNGRGFLNEGEKIGDPAFETVTGTAFSSGGALWLGVALSDLLVLSMGVGGGSFRKAGLRAYSAVFQFRIEAYPFFSLGGAWMDIGVLATSGVGVFGVQDAGEDLVNGGGTSALGVGVFYEPWRWAGLSMGPQLEYTGQFSENLSANTLVLGWRTAFYAEP